MGGHGVQVLFCRVYESRRSVTEAGGRTPPPAAEVYGARAANSARTHTNTSSRMPTGRAPDVCRTRNAEWDRGRARGAGYSCTGGCSAQVSSSGRRDPDFRACARVASRRTSARVQAHDLGCETRVFSTRRSGRGTTHRSTAESKCVLVLGGGNERCELPNADLAPTAGRDVLSGSWACTVLWSDVPVRFAGATAAAETRTRVLRGRRAERRHRPDTDCDSRGTRACGRT